MIILGPAVVPRRKITPASRAATRPTAWRCSGGLSKAVPASACRAPAATITSSTRSAPSTTAPSRASRFHGAAAMRFETDGANRAVANEVRALERSSSRAPRRPSPQPSATRPPPRTSSPPPPRPGRPRRADSAPARRRVVSSRPRRAGHRRARDRRPAGGLRDGKLENGGLGPWTRTGKAFDPARSSAPPSRPQAEMRPRGTYAVNSYAGHDGNGDSYLGTLTSAPSTAKPRSPSLVNGGDQEATRIKRRSGEPGGPRDRARSALQPLRLAALRSHRAPRPVAACARSTDSGG